MAEKTTLLLIDDEEDFTHFIKLNLELDGRFTIYTATDGRQGIALAKQYKPDLVLLDILMPQMHGTDVAEQLLSGSETKDIPIVYLTAVVRKEDVEAKGGVIGGRQFIAKPVGPDDLIAKIERVLGLGSL